MQSSVVRDRISAASFGFDLHVQPTGTAALLGLFVCLHLYNLCGEGDRGLWLGRSRRFFFKFCCAQLHALVAAQSGFAAGTAALLAARMPS